MKKIFSVIVAVVLSISGFAQRHFNHHFLFQNTNQTNYVPYENKSCEKTTTIGDTTILKHISTNDTLALYNVGTTDSGFLSGTNVYNDMGFAERYDFNSKDSSISILGVMALFGGKVNPASTQSVTLKIWDCSAPVFVTTNVYYNGYPSNVLDSLVVPFTSLGIGGTGDTLKRFMFQTPVVALSMPFFAGYTMNYNFESLAGDTIGLQCSKNGERTNPLYYIDTVVTGVDTVYDTTINVQNATLWSENIWHDNYTQNDSLFNNLAIYPIVVSHNPTGIKGITKNSLTFFGNYPNPATITTNIRFSLAHSEDVIIRVYDILGHELKMLSNKNLIVGEHIINLDTKEFISGDYFYVIQLSSGEGFAGKISIVK